MDMSLDQYIAQNRIRTPYSKRNIPLETAPSKFERCDREIKQELIDDDEVSDSKFAINADGDINS